VRLYLITYYITFCIRGILDYNAKFTVSSFVIPFHLHGCLFYHQPDLNQVDCHWSILSTPLKTYHLTFSGNPLCKYDDYNPINMKR